MKPDLKIKITPKARKIIISVVAVVLVLAIGLGIWYNVGHSSSEPVNVYSFSYIGMTEYWGDSQESYGPVTTDRIQTIYLSDTQTVTEILVSAGDTVKKGDLLMTFDTTLSDLALERERLEVEKLKLQLQDARAQLAEINSMKPMVIPTTTPDDGEEEEEDLGTALKGDYQISTQKTYDGSTQELALICWLSENADIDDALLEAIRQAAEDYQERNAEEAAAQEPSEIAYHQQGYTIRFLSAEVDGLNDESSTDVPTDKPTDPDTPSTDDPTDKPTDPDTPSTDDPTDKPTDPDNPSTDDSTVPTDPVVEPTEPDIDLDVNRYYVIFKVTQSDMSLGQTKLWQGLLVTRNPGTNTFSFKFFDATYMKDHMLAQPSSPSDSMPEIDYGSGYTAAQIAQMRSEQEKTIKDLQFQIKMAEADYKIMQTEVTDGNVYAEIDGEVVSVLTEEEAKLTMQPVLKVSGGGGFYVEGFVSELEKDNLAIGQEVTVNDWNTGMVYTGTIQSIGDFPSPDGYWNGMGNPNASYYPFSVFIDGSADLQAGYYVNVTYSSATAENGIYLEKPFLRTEQGESYVFVQGENGKLEKRYVTTGKSLWGSYTEILDGITAEDFIAFPYGKNVREGAVTRESDLSELYNY